MLNSEGLTAFVNASYGWGRPGTEMLERSNYKTRSTLVEAGLSFPVIRSRERNLTLTGLAFVSDNHSDILHAPFNEDRLRGMRVKADADLADACAASTSSTHLQPGHRRARQHRERQSAGVARRRAGRFQQGRGYVGRLQPLIGTFSAYLAAYGQYAFTPLLTPEQCGYGGRSSAAPSIPRSCSAIAASRCSANCATTLPIGGTPLTQAQLYGFADYGQLWTRAAALGTPADVGRRLGRRRRAARLEPISPPISRSRKAIEGPRDDWRFFFILAARY